MSGLIEITVLIVLQRSELVLLGIRRVNDRVIGVIFIRGLIARPVAIIGPSDRLHSLGFGVFLGLLSWASFHRR